MSRESLEERRVWTYAAIALVVPVVYFAVVLSRLSGEAVAELEYAGAMLLAIGAAMVLNMLFGPHGKQRRDERDVEIHRRGEHVGFYVLAAVVAAALAMTLAQFAHFWIANALYLAFVLNALTSSAWKIVAYRRGL